MIVDPAVLTTLLTLARTHGYLMTVVGFGLNLVIVWAALRWAALIGRVLGGRGLPGHHQDPEPRPRGHRGDLRATRADCRAGAVSPGNSVTV